MKMKDSVATITAIASATGKIIKNNSAKEKLKQIRKTAKFLRSRQSRSLDVIPREADWNDSKVMNDGTATPLRQEKYNTM